LDDRTYLATGGGSGIGEGVAEALVQAGGNVLIVRAHGRPAWRKCSVPLAT
jgi:NAD(P)-dependent dehydrogenase (short-subunit alcohol dehydrogenase family)